MAESSLPRDSNDNMNESNNVSVSMFGDLYPIRITDTNNAFMIDFEAEYALMTREPPYDPNEDRTDVADTMSINKYITPLGGEWKSINNNNHPQHTNTISMTARWQ